MEQTERRRRPQVVPRTATTDTVETRVLFFCCTLQLFISSRCIVRTTRMATRQIIPKRRRVDQPHPSIEVTQSEKHMLQLIERFTCQIIFDGTFDLEVNTNDDKRLWSNGSIRFVSATRPFGQTRSMIVSMGVDLRAHLHWFHGQWFNYSQKRFGLGRRRRRRRTRARSMKIFLHSIHE